MKNNGVRVVIASERLEVRHLLERMVESEGGVTVGHAADAPKTMTLVSGIKPDVVIIDCNLPYVANQHTLPLSRVGGLDIAQRISRESPGTEAILLSNLDTLVVDPRNLLTDRRSYSMRSVVGNTALVLGNLGQAAAHRGDLVFANVEAKAQELPEASVMSLGDKTMLAGVVAIALGLFMIISWISATIGAAVVLGGVTLVMAVMGGKATASLWSRIFGKRL